MMQVAYLPTSPAAALSTASIICSVAWYFAGTSASIAAVSVVPTVVDLAVEGVSDVVVEAVEGSKLVVRCISIGIVFIAATALVRIGYSFLAILNEQIITRAAFGRIKNRNPPDQFEQRYGPRLRGGAPKLGLFTHPS